MHMTNDEYVERRTARDILSMIEQVYFSDEYKEYRINRGYNGVRDLIIGSIEERYLKGKYLS